MHCFFVGYPQSLEPLTSPGSRVYIINVLTDVKLIQIQINICLALQCIESMLSLLYILLLVSI